jgi:hypothetical protein
MIHLQYKNAYTGETYEHPYNGNWEKYYRESHRCAEMSGQTCSYESPEHMARRMAESKRKDPTVAAVELTIR